MLMMSAEDDMPRYALMRYMKEFAEERAPASMPGNDMKEEPYDVPESECSACAHA